VNLFQDPIFPAKMDPTRIGIAFGKIVVRSIQKSHQDTGTRFRKDPLKLRWIECGQCPLAINSRVTLDLLLPVNIIQQTVAVLLAMVVTSIIKVIPQNPMVLTIQDAIRAVMLMMAGGTVGISKTDMTSSAIDQDAGAAKDCVVDVVAAGAVDAAVSLEREVALETVVALVAPAV